MSLQLTVAASEHQQSIRDLYKGINKFKNGCQPRRNLVKDENCDMLADSHNSILNRLENYFSQLLNVHNVSDVRQIEVHSAEISTWSQSLKLKLLSQSRRSINHQVAELIQAGGEILLSVIHKLINYVWNKEELPDQWKESIIVPVRKKGASQGEVCT
jgi:hypothetical protein